MNKLVLLPNPRSLRLQEGSYSLAPDGTLVLQTDNPSKLLPSAHRLAKALTRHAGVKWGLSVVTPEENTAKGALLRLAPERIKHPEGYELTINSQGILIEAHAPAGIFYGVATLIQLLQQRQGELPHLQIADWPDFSARGVMLDISRDKVPSLQTLLDMVDLFASWKINQLQLYTEHTFAYAQHPEVWAKASPITPEEIQVLDAYCRERFVELVPNQNSFGHMHRYLRHERYAHLSEVAAGEDIIPGQLKGPFTINPTHPESIDLIASLYQELLPNFTSKIFNVGCDETFDLGMGASKAECERVGKHRVYFDFLLKIYQLVQQHGHTMQFWGDVIIEHPELLPELPKENVILLEWGYEADHPFSERLVHYAKAGIPFYVCPGTSSWCSLGGRTDNTIGNLVVAAEQGLKHGAIGYLNTDWGDRGHWQVLPVSYIGFALGAAVAWALDANRDIDIAAATSLYAFEDPSGAMGKVAYQLGNVYQAIKPRLPNSSALFWALQFPLDRLRENEYGVDLSTVEQALPAIEQALAPLEQHAMRRPDAALIVDEFQLSARMMRYGARRLQLARDGQPQLSAKQRAELNQELKEIVAEYRRIWLARNREGGLGDSVARLEAACKV